MGERGGQRHTNGRENKERERVCEILHLMEDLIKREGGSSEIFCDSFG
jgi:hypothetical protein